MLQLGLSDQLKHLLSRCWPTIAGSCNFLLCDFKALLWQSCQADGSGAAATQQTKLQADTSHAGRQLAAEAGAANVWLLQNPEGFSKMCWRLISKWRFHIFWWNLGKIMEGNAANPITWATMKYLIPPMKPTMKCSCCAVPSREQKLSITA